jgi:hypothetical protein
MRPLVRTLAVSGHLAAIQLGAGVVCWLAAPLPALALMVTLGWLLVLAWDIRHARLAGCLPRPLLALALALSEAPALVFGAWNILHFLGHAPRFELGAVVIQLWLTPLAPLVAWCPSGSWLGREWWLWLLSADPYLLVAAGVLAARVRPAGPAALAEVRLVARS